MATPAKGPTASTDWYDMGLKFISAFGYNAPGQRGLGESVGFATDQSNIYHGMQQNRSQVAETVNRLRQPDVDAQEGPPRQAPTLTSALAGGRTPGGIGPATQGIDAGRGATAESVKKGKQSTLTGNVAGGDFDAGAPISGEAGDTSKHTTRDKYAAADKELIGVLKGAAEWLPASVKLTGKSAGAAGAGLGSLWDMLMDRAKSQKKEMKIGMSKGGKVPAYGVGGVIKGVAPIAGTAIGTYFGGPAGGAIGGAAGSAIAGGGEEAATEAGQSAVSVDPLDNAMMSVTEKYGLDQLEPVSMGPSLAPAQGGGLAAGPVPVQGYNQGGPVMYAVPTYATGGPARPAVAIGRQEAPSDARNTIMFRSSDAGTDDAMAELAQIYADRIMHTKSTESSAGMGAAATGLIMETRRRKELQYMLAVQAADESGDKYGVAKNFALGKSYALDDDYNSVVLGGNGPVIYNKANARTGEGRDIANNPQTGAGLRQGVLNKKTIQWHIDRLRNPAVVGRDNAEYLKQMHKERIETEQGERAGEQLKINQAVEKDRAAEYGYTSSDAQRKLANEFIKAKTGYNQRAGTTTSETTNQLMKRLSGVNEGVAKAITKELEFFNDPAKGDGETYLGIVPLKVLQFFTGTETSDSASIAMEWQNFVLRNPANQTLSGPAIMRLAFDAYENEYDKQASKQAVPAGG